MSISKSMILAAAAALAFGGAAAAQTASTTADQPTQAQPAQQAAAPASATIGDPAAAPGSATNPIPQSSPTPVDQAAQLKAGDSSVVSNGPVPDTRANRAKYGQPMSNAGKRTRPAGN
jgi:hypothetical protein